jgi:hypothetical protein
LETLSDKRTITEVIKPQAKRQRIPYGPATLDGVGGQVFTRRIEHIFEYAMIQVGQKVLL